ncbi:MAG: MarR family winged helix-turn-helix transcriptional regulator [Candidatus Geothermincolia bacterium]
MTEDHRCELASEFLIHFGGIARGMDAVFRKEMEAHGVTWPQFYLLKVLSRQGPLTVTELSGSLLVAAPTASRMIDGLREKGLLDKTRDPGDHRVTVVTLTRKSRKLLERLLALQNEVMRIMFEGEETADIENSVKSLGRYVGRLHETARIRARKGAQDE